METYDEINLWEYLQVLYHKRFLILAFIVIPIISSFFISIFFIDKQYQSEMWISINDGFPGNNEENSVERLKAYCFYPETILATFKDKSVRGVDLQNSLSQIKVGDLVQILYTHTFDSNAPDLLLRWLLMTKFKMILDENSQLQNQLEEDIMLIQTNLDFRRKDLSNMKSMLSRIAKFNDIEVVPKETVEPKVFVFKELNPYYVNLNRELNDLELEIEQLQNQEFFMKALLLEYQKLLTQINILFSEEETDEKVTDEQIKTIEKKYNVYLQEIKNESKSISFIPFKIISAPSLNPNTISPNIMLNVLLAGFIGLLVGVVLAFLLNYIENMKNIDFQKTITP